MPNVAQWTGTPSVKGSTESMRMALLTASLIGLQYAPSPAANSRSRNALANRMASDSHGTSR
jgi:hypothetical protein